MIEDILVLAIAHFYNTDDLSVIDPTTDEHITNACGGLLHIALDDGNLDDESVTFCLAESIRYKDKRAEAIALALLSLSKSARERVYDRYEEYSYKKRYLV